tara:strand:+ start:78 stop:356 length:279 start_codon:yes stop_codon:yes gene_type:complete
MNNLQEKLEKLLTQFEKLEMENNRLKNVERIYSKYLDKAYQEIKELKDTVKTIRQNKENKRDMLNYYMVENKRLKRVVKDNDLSTIYKNSKY